MSDLTVERQELSLRNQVGMLWLSDGWETVQANAAMLDMLEVDRVEDLRGAAPEEFIAPDFRDALSRERLRRAAGQASVYETVLVGRKGTERRVVVSAAPLMNEGSFSGAIATFIDVTHLRRAEDALRDTTQRYQAVVNALGDGVVVIDRSGEIQEANASAARIMGTDVKGNIFPLPSGWCVRDAQGREVSSHEFPAAITLNTGRPCRNVVQQLERPDGTTVWISVNTEPLFHHGEGLPSLVICSFHDISELKESHRQLSVREARLAKLLDAVPDLLFLLSADGVYLDYRASRPELLFRRPEEFVGRHMSDVLPPEVLEPCERTLRSAIETGRTQSVEYNSDVLGSRLYFEARITPFDPGTFLMIVRDVTEARLAEQRLRQHEQELAHLARLGALGEMVAGISHEINQPLHAIANFAAASINKLSSGDEDAKDTVGDWLQKIARQAFRASEIVKRFRHFSSPTAQVAPVAVSDLLQEALELVQGEFRRRNVQVEINNRAGDAPIVVDRIQLQQVLVNFLVNARESLESNPAADRRVVVDARIEGERLVCEVIDNGRGLPGVPTAQLFDAFYTTKRHGLGLGLAISRTIIESHGGRIWARPNAPRGAAFGLEVPQWQDAGPAAHAPNRLHGA